MPSVRLDSLTFVHIPRSAGTSIGYWLKENKGNADTALKLVERIKKSIQNPNFVGDISLLSSKIDELQVIAAVKKAEFTVAKSIAKEKAMEKRTNRTTIFYHQKTSYKIYI